MKINIVNNAHYTKLDSVSQQLPEQDEFLNAKSIVRITENEILNHALYYAKIGYPVLPLHNVIINKSFVRCSCKDWKNCLRQGKHPRTRFGHKEATIDEDKIKDWWKTFPNANIAILTGITTGIFVLDIDIQHGGEHSFEEIKDFYRLKLKDNYDCEATLTTLTGSGGRHLYFKHPLKIQINGSTSLIDKGLDIRGEENYIIVPPSNHKSGKKYSWFGVNTPIEDAPNWLNYELLTAEKSKIFGASGASGATILTEQIKDGERNTYLHRQACGLVNSFAEKQVLEILLAKNTKNLINPLPEAEVKRIVKSVWNRYGNSKNMGLRK
ncbi:MAG TPA: bifunctional DNA primase/polymerase [Pyrinomonadaceae bacterium]|jgi:putative DNA primase/helicase